MLIASVLFTLKTEAQLLSNEETFTKDDTLRGSLNENRSWWNVQRYDISVTPNYERKEINGRTIIEFNSKTDGTKKMQIDLQNPLVIDSVFLNEAKVKFKKTSLHTWTVDVTVESTQYIDRAEGGKGVMPKANELTIYYHGKPKEAINPPWDGGWIWKKDEQGRPWMSVAVQGLGASAWYPCKDHQSDEPERGAWISITVPDTLIAVSNGKQFFPPKIVKDNTKQTTDNINKTYVWFINNPINNYCIIPYIGNYVNFTDTLMGEKGRLDLNYWVLDYNLQKAKEQFKQVKPMLRAFEYWFCPYPFYEDGYKLVDAPHLGMEHQSAIAYGNKYKNGYLGRDRSGTGWGSKWDFIIIHESGHEWFANNITCKDIADMWIHESFTNYSETLFTEYYYGKDAANEFNFGQRRNIRNKTPIIGPYGVNKEGSGDMYDKGGNMLHTIRHSLNDDTLFRKILRGLNRDFYHQTVTTEQVEKYISKKSGFDFTNVFNQYLRSTQIPELLFYIEKKNNSVQFKWSNCEEQFNLPLVIQTAKSNKKIYPTTTWQTKQLTKEEIQWWNADNIIKWYYISCKEQSAKP